MSQRMFNPKFWRDTYIDSLDPSEKLLFIYLFTNGEANMCGIYEMPKRTMASDTGFDVSMLDKLFKRLEDDHKAYYIDGWVWMVNTEKHQNLRSPNIVKGIARELAEVPQEILEQIDKIRDTVKGKKGLAKGLQTITHVTKPNVTKPNLTKPNLTKPNRESLTPVQISKSFFADGSQEQENVVQFLLDNGLQEATARKEIEKFVDYWTEPNKSGTKTRWELQKTFDVHRRLKTWFRNSQKFNGSFSGYSPQEKTVSDFSS